MVGRRLTSLLLALLATMALLAPATTAADAQNRVRAFHLAAPTHAGDSAAQNPCKRPGSTVSGPEVAAGCCVAAKPVTRGGVGPVRLGQAGEDAIRGAYDIGPTIKVDVAGTKRIPDRLTATTLSEVKNVGSLSYSRQLRDFERYAQDNGLAFDLLSDRTLASLVRFFDARAAGRINVREIP